MNIKAEKVCPICDKKFMGTNAQVYCGKECRREAEYRRIKERRLKTFQCEFCGEVFHGDRRRKYCGAICRDKANGKRSINTKKKKPIMSIEQVALLSREAGLTYGVYVAKMGL